MAKNYFQVIYFFLSLDSHYKDNTQQSLSAYHQNWLIFLFFAFGLSTRFDEFLPECADIAPLLTIIII